MFESFNFQNKHDNQSTHADNLDMIPVQDKSAIVDDTLRRSRHAMVGRGMKRRSSSVNSETPTSTFQKCLRSKSPTMQKELQAVAATLLKPDARQNVFKVPNNTGPAKPNISSFFKSPSGSSRQALTFDTSHSNREYYTASSMRSSGEKFSLPNYTNARQEKSFPSPTSSVRSQNTSHEGQLKRTSSQLSNGSEFQDDFLPIKINRNSRKLSWPSVKLYQSVTKSISIQNGSNKKLPLRVRVVGAGFSVSNREDLRMIPQEARTFEITYSPTVVGPSEGKLIFELVTNSKCNQTIPLFAFGGHAMMKCDGVLRGPVGPEYISLGLVKMLNSTMEHQIRITNCGTLGGFAALCLENVANFSDFNVSKSLVTSPSQVRLSPGESTVITIKFKATKEEIRKIISLNKEVTTIGKICIISGDEPTRLRLIKHHDQLPEGFTRILTEKMPNDSAYQHDLLTYNENLDSRKITSLAEKVRIREIEVTISRNLDETQIVNAELSMNDDTCMSFETFYENHQNHTIIEPSKMMQLDEDDETAFDDE